MLPEHRNNTQIEAACRTMLEEGRRVKLAEIAAAHVKIAAANAKYARLVETVREYGVEVDEPSGSSGTTVLIRNAASRIDALPEPPQPEPAPATNGLAPPAPSEAVREYVQATNGVFSFYDMLRALRERDIPGNRDAFATAIKRMVAKGKVRVVRSGNAHRPAKYERISE